MKRLKKIVFSGLALVVLAVAAFASCQAIADTTGLIQTPETVWIRLVPSVASLGKAKLVLDFSKAIPGLTNDTPTADLRTLFTFANGEGCTEAEKITPVHITKDSEAVYTLTVEQVPNAEKGIVLVTIHQLGIAPPTRAWSLDGEVYEISLSRTDNGGALENTSYSFPEAVTGYGAQTALSVTVANTGSAPTGELNITLSGDAAAQFSLSASTLASIAAGGTGGKIFTVQANDGLDVGDYTALVTVGGGNSIEASFTVQLSVVAPPLWSHNAEELAPLPEYYVTQNGRGDKDGRDWDNAVNKLKLFDVLEKAAVLGAGGVVKVYVAAGTYIPWNTHGDDAPISNAASFPLAGNVAVYGGFANRLSGTVNAADMSAREARFNTDGAGKGYGTILPGSLDYETILSGDLNGDDEYDATGLLSGN
ncbi:MAG: hypothetical protein LBT01_02785, partial [Spirochaetaceae bacterium]|nr:hypothetical protein [Spirochaetaceae bacterium]